MARHPRDACPWFAFYAPAWFGPTARNARRCRGCVCAGCGRRARRCPDWGDGVRPLDHCNWPSSSAGAGVPSSSASPSSPSPPSSADSTSSRVAPHARVPSRIARKEGLPMPWTSASAVAASEPPMEPMALPRRSGRR